jgi:hypothetical protein
MECGQPIRVSLVYLLCPELSRIILNGNQENYFTLYMDF